MTEKSNVFKNKGALHSSEQIRLRSYPRQYYLCKVLNKKKEGTYKAIVF
jgi:hypothetical protein